MSTVEIDTEMCQQAVTFFAQMAYVQDVESIKRYLEKAGPQFDGAWDAIIPHFMSISDMRIAQRKGKYICAVLRHILAIRELTEKEIQEANNA